MFITTSTGELTVLEPLPGSPAEQAGLRRHDKIKPINGYETTGMTANDLATRGCAARRARTVRLTIQRVTISPSTWTSSAPMSRCRPAPPRSAPTRSR